MAKSSPCLSLEKEEDEDDCLLPGRLNSGRLRLFQVQFTPDDKKEEEFVSGRLNSRFTQGEEHRNISKEEDKFIRGRLNTRCTQGEEHRNSLGKQQEEFIPGRLNARFTQGNEHRNTISGDEDEFVPGRLNLRFTQGDEHRKIAEDDKFIPGKLAHNSNDSPAENELEFTPGRLGPNKGAATTGEDRKPEDEFTPGRLLVLNNGGQLTAQDNESKVLPEKLPEDCAEFHPEGGQMNANNILPNSSNTLLLEEAPGTHCQKEDDSTPGKLLLNNRKEQPQAQSSIVDWTLSESSFAWVQDHELMQEIQAEKQTQEKLTEWIRVCTNWNRQLAVDESKLKRQAQDLKALVKLMKKIVSAQEKGDREMAQKLRIEFRIFKLMHLVESKSKSGSGGVVEEDAEIMKVIQSVAKGATDRAPGKKKNKKNVKFIDVKEPRDTSSRTKKKSTKRRDKGGRKKISNSQADMHESAFLLDLIGLESDSAANFHASSRF